MDMVRALKPMTDPDASLPFIHTILSTLREEVAGQSTLLGFIGTPWTLAAYAVEGKADRHCRQTKTMMARQPAVLHALLAALSDALITYVCYQIHSGAQVCRGFLSFNARLNLRVHLVQIETAAMPRLVMSKGVMFNLQVVQLFDSWAHHLSPDQFAEFSLPYAERVISGVRAKHPDVPLIFHANGGRLASLPILRSF